jgi:hypothetical protein
MDGWLFVGARFDKYYVVFFLGEGAIMLSGLGYNGRDANGHVLWCGAPSFLAFLYCCRKLWLT